MTPGAEDTAESMLSAILVAILHAGALHHATPHLTCRTCSSAPAAPFDVTRRGLLGAALGCGCSVCAAAPANALAALTVPPADLLVKYDTPRNAMKDAGFAAGMASGMFDYEHAVAPTKRKLFDRMLSALPAAERTDAPVVVELGMGSFPNAQFYASAKAPLDVVGVDPNDSMKAYAMRNSQLLLRAGSSVRVAHGVAEALPFASKSVDAVVCTLTLCSVPTPEVALAEVQRVLKPGGQFLFLEHVKSETDEKLAAVQEFLNPQQVARADGCNLNRRTLQMIKAANFASLDAEYFELTDFYVLNPTVAGIARM